MTANALGAAVGRLLDGRYRVRSPIADGGMATVHLARDERLDRDVAVKVLRADLARDGTFVGRFRREARLAAGLSHPNVVAVFDVGEDAGDLFLVMEHVPGVTLRQHLQRHGPLRLREALTILAQVLQALDVAHRAGLVHRDVKPENVLLRDDGTVKVADFGLARAVSSTTTTGYSGVLLGTVAYLAPEQVDRGPVDARSDLYAAGLVLYEMLTGQQAFCGDTPLHVAYQHVHGSVPDVSERIASVPAQVTRIVAKASARHPGDRFQTAAELLSQVRHLLAQLPAEALDAPVRLVAPAAGTPGEPAPSQPDAVAVTPAEPLQATSPQANATGPTTPLRRRTGRRRAVLMAAVLVLAVVAGGGWLWFDRFGPGSQRLVPQLAGMPRPQAEQALAAADLRADVSTAHDETAAKETVVSTQPDSGTSVRKHTAVSVVISLGPERYAVPQLVGIPRDQVEGRLAERRLAVGQVEERFSETVPAGVVLSQDPPADTPQKRDTPVALVVSKGRQPIAVPDTSGKPAEAAQQTLQSLGLKVEQGEPAHSDTVPAGAVLSQTPRSGTLFRGGSVTLVVSKGPVLVPVPAVALKSPAEATALLEAAGFQVQVEKYYGGVLNTVRFQNPAGGKPAPKGSTVTVTVW